MTGCRNVCLGFVVPSKGDLHRARVGTHEPGFAALGSGRGVGADSIATTGRTDCDAAFHRPWVADRSSLWHRAGLVARAWQAAKQVNRCGHSKRLAHDEDAPGSPGPVRSADGRACSGSLQLGTSLRVLEVPGVGVDTERIPEGCRPSSIAPDRCACETRSWNLAGAHAERLGSLWR